MHYFALLLVRLFSGLLDGVLHLIRLGLVHGDLKPENVLVVRGAGARWMVADFGCTAGSTVFKSYHQSCRVDLPEGSYC